MPRDSRSAIFSSQQRRRAPRVVFRQAFDSELAVRLQNATQQVGTQRLDQAGGQRRGGGDRGKYRGAGHGRMNGAEVP